jgi:nucleolin
MSETKSQTKLFIANLPWALRGKDLKEIFSEYGEVAYAKVILDRETGKSKGFGFIEFVNAEDAAKAVQDMNEAEINGRSIKLDFAVEKPQNND